MIMKTRFNMSYSFSKPNNVADCWTENNFVSYASHNSTRSICWSNVNILYVQNSFSWNEANSCSAHRTKM